MVKLLKRLWILILDVFYPPKCILCGKLLSKDEVDLCLGCRLRLPLFQGDRASGLYVSKVYPLFFYEDNVRSSILRYKFQGVRHYCKFYGNLLAMSIGAKAAGDYDGVVWVPVSARRRRGRGYDQSQLIAQVVAKQLNLPLIPALKKIRNNPAQSSKGNPEARRANVMGVYKVENITAIFGKKLLLIDDIWTTGATANEAARMLLTGGAISVDCGVVAATRER